MNRPTSSIILVLTMAHLVVIALSNYHVQIPFSLLSIESNLGTLSFPLIFLLSDLTTRLLGKKQAQAVVWQAMFPALLVSYVVSVLFFQTQFQGFGALGEFNLFVFRIALASFVAYASSQWLDIALFSYFKQRFDTRFGDGFLLTPALSTLLASALDTFIFYSLAFYQSPDAFMANNWVEMAWVDYVFKLWVSLVFILPIYRFTLKKALKV